MSYQDYPDHPLANVPEEVLECARKVLREAVVYNDVDADQAEPIADSVIIELVKAGHLSFGDLNE